MRVIQNQSTHSFIHRWTVGLVIETFASLCNSPDFHTSLNAERGKYSRLFWGSINIDCVCLAANSRLLCDSRSIVLSSTPARVSLVIRFSSQISCWHSRNFVSYMSSWWAVIVGERCYGLGGGGVRGHCSTRVAFRSIKIKSSRKYNLLSHCSPSGARRLARARRIKYIDKQT